jgi:hypothetical protein
MCVGTMLNQCCDQPPQMLIVCTSMHAYPSSADKQRCMSTLAIWRGLYSQERSDQQQSCGGGYLRLRLQFGADNVLERVQISSKLADAVSQLVCSHGILFM